jgi:hypothetical protein
VSVCVCVFRFHIVIINFSFDTIEFHRFFFFLSNDYFLVRLVVLIFIQQSIITVDMFNEFPRILTSSYNQTSNLSDTTILTCHVTNLGHHHVTWLKYDSTSSTYSPLSVGEQVFLSDKRYFISSYSTFKDDSYWNLEISHVQLSDEGIYECKIANRRASVAIRIHLQVQIPMSIQPARLSVEPGSSVELDCTIYNLNTSSITWHFSSSDRTYVYQHYHEEIDETFRYENNLSKSQLIIRHAQPYHSGLWTCTYKRHRRSAKLFVEKGHETLPCRENLSLHCVLFCFVFFV